MMGHHGMGFLFGLIDEVLEQNRENRERKPRERSDKEELEEELKIAYARGDIDDEAFRRMRTGIGTGEFTWQDLERLKTEAAEARLAEIPEERELRRASAEIERQKRALVQAEEESSALVASLNDRALALKAEAAELETKARETLKADEAAARLYIEQRQDVDERAAKIEQQLAALRRDLERVEDLRAALSEKEEELRVARSRGRIAVLGHQIQKK